MQAPGFNAVRDKLTLLFCANAVGFRIRTALIYKAANPRALRGKDKQHLLVFFFFLNKFIYLFIFGCVGSLLLHAGFL